MPRQLRFPVPGIPQHIIQRGNDRQACFFEDEDRDTCLFLFEEAAADTDCEIHAYVLMTNHVHLLATPRTAHGIPRMMQHLGRRYVQQINACYRRTGTLWEGRYKATVVNSDEYVLQCYRYIELNPVRAGMERSPAIHRWSSYRHNALGDIEAFLVPHETYRSLGRSPQARQLIYRLLVDEGLADIQIKEIRQATQRAWPLGNAQFDAQREVMLKRRIPRNAWGGDRRSAEK